MILAQPPLGIRPLADESIPPPHAAIADARKKGAITIACRRRMHKVYPRVRAEV